MVSQVYRSVDDLLGQTELPKRVFIGGNYDNIAVLREIKNLVRNCGLQPALALDIEIATEEIHREDIRLLSNCSYAIFEETFPAGELMELERAKDFLDLNLRQIYVFYQVRFDKEKEKPAQLSSMVISLARQIKGGQMVMEGYLDFEDLSRVIKKIFGGWP